MATQQSKAPIDFTMKDWKNLGIYITLLGLLALFVVRDYKLGLGLTLVGLVFIAIFQGPKILKILNKKHWQ